jgi:site-specific DNA-methyltransferase (cytosine-N4-specific)
MTPARIADVAAALSVTPPLTLWKDAEGVKLEIKPYLQPFERRLADLELAALAGDGATVIGQNGYSIVTSDVSEAHLRDRLTYWQRVGTDVLVPTRQTLLELCQNGSAPLAAAYPQLHRARRLRYGVHGLHEYRGKFFPQLVRSLINVSKLAPDAVVLDPMCGSGTTPCEAVALSNHALGMDLNPLSVLMTRVKCAVATAPKSFPADTRKAVAAFKHPTVPAASVWPQDIDYLAKWFSAEALSDLASLVIEIAATKPLVRGFLFACLSNIVRSASWQKEADLRVRKEIRDYPSGHAMELFLATVEDQLDRIEPYQAFLPDETRGAPYDIREGDATKVDKAFNDFRGKVDLIITSPPYATALPYLDTDRLSLIVLGLLPRQRHRRTEALMIGTREVSEAERKAEWRRFQAEKEHLPEAVVRLINEIAEQYHGDSVGFRRRNLPALLAKYYLAITDSMRSAHRLMRPGSNAFYVVGNNSTTVHGERVEIPTDEFLGQIGELAGWSHIDTIGMELLPSRDIFRENRGSKEKILWFRA